MIQNFEDDIEKVGRIDSVPTILEVVCRTTGMGFAAVARVTENRWIACRVLDEIQFGLKPGGELPVETTICHEIWQTRQAVMIDDVPNDVAWSGHATPAMYGFQSYISVPILLADGSFFGTLCAIDPHPARVNTPGTVGMFRLFADLIAKNLDSNEKLIAAESTLVEERAVAQLREEFIAVVGHDLRAPMRAIRCFADLLLRTPLDKRALEMATTIRDSSARMQALIDNLLDFARGRLGGGLSLKRSADEPLEPLLREVVTEVSAVHPNRRIETVFRLTAPVTCDRMRMTQLFSNLLMNAVTYGSADHPVRVEAASDQRSFELSVANAGEQIPKETLARLFQPFFRGSPLQASEGLGLGLHIASEIAAAHGGTLDVQSTREETRFTLRMPAGG